jgi:hypothetical protein
MRRRYIVAVSGLTKDDEKLFLDFLKEKRLAWWHWIDGFWPLVSETSFTNYRLPVEA